MSNQPYPLGTAYNRSRTFLFTWWSNHELTRCRVTIVGRFEHYGPSERVAYEEWTPMRYAAYVSMEAKSE